MSVGKCEACNMGRHSECLGGCDCECEGPIVGFPVGHEHVGCPTCAQTLSAVNLKLDRILAILEPLAALAPLAASVAAMTDGEESPSIFKVLGALRSG